MMRYLQKSNILLLVTLCVVTSLMEAQTVLTLKLDSSPTGDISLSPFDTNRFPVFMKVLNISPWAARMQPALFVISNQSDKAIIAVAVHWTIIGSDGKQTQQSSLTHSYVSPGAPPIVPPHGSLLVGPRMWFPDYRATSEAGIFVPPPESLVTKIQSAAEVRASIDSVIFADGEVIGKNVLDLTGEIRDRKIAVELICSRVREAQAKGEDPVNVLRQDRQSRSPFGDRVNRHRTEFINHLLNTRHFDAYITFIESIKAVPIFYRKDGSRL